MSLLRDRAIDVRVESTLRARRPAGAPGPVVRAAGRPCGRAEGGLNWPELHASVGLGAPNMPTAVSENARATIIGRRRGVALGRGGGPVGAAAGGGGVWWEGVGA